MSNVVGWLTSSTLQAGKVPHVCSRCFHLLRVFSSPRCSLFRCHHCQQRVTPCISVRTEWPCSEANLQTCLRIWNSLIPHTHVRRYQTILKAASSNDLQPHSSSAALPFAALPLTKKLPSKHPKPTTHHAYKRRPPPSTILSFSTPIPSTRPIIQFSTTFHSPIPPPNRNENHKANLHGSAPQNLHPPGLPLRHRKAPAARSRHRESPQSVRRDPRAQGLERVCMNSLHPCSLIDWFT